MSSAVLESEDECSEGEKLRRGGWRLTFQDWLWDDIKHRQTTWCGRTWFHRVCFMLVSCALHWPDFPSTHLCPIRLISPALHLHCTSFTGLSSSSSTSLLLLFFCSFPSPVSLHLHSSPSLGLFVSLCCWLALCQSVCSALVLSFLLSFVFPPDFMCSPVCSLFLLYSLSKLPSPVGLLWPVCLSTFGFCVVWITYKRREDTHILCVLAFGSWMTIDSGSSRQFSTFRHFFLTCLIIIKKKTSFSTLQPSNFPVGVESKTWATDKTQSFLCGRWFWSRKHQITCPSVGRSVGAIVDG